MEARSGFDDDGTMEDAMAEQDELESRVSVAACLSGLKALFPFFSFAILNSIMNWKMFR